MAKAAQDELVLERFLDDRDVSDEVFDFHAQQAAEKLLKAVIASRSIRVRKTHDLVAKKYLAMDAVRFSDVLIHP